jgi:hypothetical protein
MRLFQTFLLISILSLNSCHAQKTVLTQNDSIKEALFTIEKCSVRDIYPGMSDGRNSYRQHWIILLQGPGQTKASLFLLHKGYQIPLGQLVEMGIVIGSDRDNYQIEFDVQYPLELNYSPTEIDDAFDSGLLIIRDNETYQYKIDNIETLEPIIYPSVGQ